MSEKDFQDTISDIKHFTRERKLAAFQYLKTQTIQFENNLEEAYVTRIQSIVEQLMLLNKKITEIEKIIQELFLEHDDAKIFSSLPGAGRRIAPALLSCFGDNRDRFLSYQQVQCYSGTAPVTEQSGKSFHRNRIRRACNKRFRNVFYMLAFCCLNKSSWARGHYDVQRKSGKSHSAAVRSVANKWAKIVYSMWANKTIYNAENFEARRQLCINS